MWPSKIVSFVWFLAAWATGVAAQLLSQVPASRANNTVPTATQGDAFMTVVTAPPSSTAAGANNSLPNGLFAVDRGLATSLSCSPTTICNGAFPTNTIVKRIKASSGPAAQNLTSNLPGTGSTARSDLRTMKSMAASVPTLISDSFDWAPRNSCAEWLWCVPDTKFDHTSPPRAVS